MLIPKFMKAFAISALTVGLVSTAPAAAQEGAEEGIGETGTDPRDFADKFMPYYRYTELENGLEQQELVMFGLMAFSPKLAMTYEIPLVRQVDFRGTSVFDPGTGTCPGLTDADCRPTGMGDMNLRFIYNPDLGFLGGDLLVGAQFDLPTATDDSLGSNQLVVSPLIVWVRDLGFWPAPGAFFAAMNFYQVDAFGDDNSEKVQQYLGRFFFMLPLHRSGIYALPEVQAIYDFDDDHFSLWIGPEFGKLLAPGRILYVKPGWGIDPDAIQGDRDFSFEVGFRYFF